MLERPRAAVAGPRPTRLPPLAAPPRAPAAVAWRWARRVLLLALVASGLIHAALIAALLFWPMRDPTEEAGQVGTVALVFADTSAQAGGGAAEQAPPPAPPAPPVVPQPPAPPVQAQVAAPPPPPLPPSQPPPAALPMPAPLPVAAPVPAPQPPAVPDGPRDIAALPPDRAGDLPAPSPPADPVPEPAAPAPPAAEPALEPAAPPPPATNPAPDPAIPAVAPAAEPVPSPQETQQAESLPLPPPPPPSPAPSQQQAAAQPAPPVPPRRQTPAAQGPVRLDAGDGNLPDPSMGSFALGAVVPPDTDPGYRNNPPDYPEAARRRGEEGVVRLNLRVGPDGRVVAAEVTTSSGYAALDRAAIEAARGWRFRPAMRAGVPVVATLTTALHFRLSETGRR